MPDSNPSRGPVGARFHSRLRPRLRFGLEWGLTAATTYAVVAVIIALLQHRTFFPQYGAGLATIIASYYVAGALCGIALAFASPLFRHRWGAAFLGFALATLAYGAIALAVFGVRPIPLGMAVALGLINGGSGALVLFDDGHYDARRPAHHDAAG